LVRSHELEYKGALSTPHVEVDKFLVQAALRVEHDTKRVKKVVVVVHVVVFTVSRIRWSSGVTCTEFELEVYALATVVCDHVSIIDDRVTTRHAGDRRIQRGITVRLRPGAAHSVDVRSIVGTLVGHGPVHVEGCFIRLALVDAHAGQRSGLGQWGARESAAVLRAQIGVLRLVGCDVNNAFEILQAPQTLRKASHGIAATRHN